MIVVRLQTIVSREIAPTDAAVVTIGSLQAGTKENVIPDEAIIKLNVRTFDEGVRKRLLDLGSVIPPPAERSPEALAGLVKSEIAKWTPVLKPATN